MRNTPDTPIEFVTPYDAYELRKGHERYELIRTLNPHQFKELCERNIRGDGHFDDLVDAAIIARRERIGKP